jgi:hypothetical protein
MAKNSIRDYSATNSSNTDIQSIDISEGCSPAGINNAIREVMADLKDVSTGAVALESPAFDSASLTGDLTFGDSDKAVFGAGADLEISHNGTENVIDSNAGTLVLRSAGAGTIELRDQGSQVLAQFNDNSDAKLYYNNNLKIATTATGVDISNSSGATLKLTSTDTSGADTELLGQIDFVSSDSSGGSAGTQARIKGVYEDNGDSSGIAFLTGASTGSGSPTLDEVMRIRHEGKVGINTVSPDETIQVFQTANAGNNYNQGTLKVGGSTTALGFQFGYHSISSGRNVITSLNNGGGSNQRISIGFGAVNGSGEPATNVMTLNQSGSVGIGHTTPQFGLTMAQGSSDSSRIGWEDGSNNKRASIICSSSSDALQFHTGTSDTERLRITSSGSLLAGTTTASSHRIQAEQSTNIASFRMTSTNTASEGCVQFKKNGTEVGYINLSSTTTTYGTSSDYRLKTAVNYDWDATTRLKQLKPARFAWIADGDDAVPVDGFLAHEVSDIVPEAIHGTKDAMRDEEYEVSAARGDIYTPAAEATFDEDGVELTAAIDEVVHSADVERPEELEEGQQWRETTAAVMGTRSVPDYQGIDQSKLVPILTKALIESVEKIEQLEARIAALETN